MYVCMYVCMHACSVCEQDLHLWTLMSRLMLTCLPLQLRSTLLVSARYYENQTIQYVMTR